jgi:stage II sporulation protein D (peptidoglycan lytic transglycosylase)
MILPDAAARRPQRAGRARPAPALVGLLLATLLASCARPAVRAPAPPPLQLPDRINVRVQGRVVSLSVEDYVLGSILAEVSPVGERPDTVARIFDVQAVLARSYLLAHRGRHAAEGFDLCDTTHCQLYDAGRVRTSRFAEAARAAVRRTAGVVLAYGGRPADAVYHADCGGQTADAASVWGGAPVPYLLAQPDDVPGLVHRHWVRSLPDDEIVAALNLDGRTAVGSRLDEIRVTSRDVSGRAALLLVAGPQRHELSGDAFRAILNRAFGMLTIESTRFTISRSGPTYRFEGFGFGHGVGLCQVGAAARARRGDSPGEILGTYFPGTRLVQLPPAVVGSWR